MPVISRANKAHWVGGGKAPVEKDAGVARDDPEAAGDGAGPAQADRMNVAVRLRQYLHISVNLSDS
jgi:hypothetical protein